VKLVHPSESARRSEAMIHSLLGSTNATDSSSLTLLGMTMGRAIRQGDLFAAANLGSPTRIHFDESSSHLRYSGLPSSIEMEAHSGSS
jgi:hypothetical protein